MILKPFVEQVRAPVGVTDFVGVAKLTSLTYPASEVTVPLGLLLKPQVQRPQGDVGPLDDGRDNSPVNSRGWGLARRA